MSKALYYKSEVEKETKSVLATEISKVVFDEPTLTDAEKMTVIKGMYRLAKAIIADLKEEEEDG